MKLENIDENAITIAIDLQGGLCDRLMLGIHGIINNAKTSLECWKFNSPDDETLEIYNSWKIDTLEDALEILKTDNFQIEVVEDEEHIRKLLKDETLQIDLASIEFNDGLYNIY